MPDKKRAFVADPFIDKLRNREELLLRFVQLWEGRLDLGSLAAAHDIQAFKSWLAVRQNDAWDEVIQNFCELQELCTEIGHACLLHVRRQARIYDPKIDSQLPVEALSLMTRIERPELFYQALDRQAFQKAEKFTVYLPPGAGKVRDPLGAADRLARSLIEHLKIDGGSERIRVRHYRESGSLHFAVYHDKRASVALVLHSKKTLAVDAHPLCPVHRDLLVYHAAAGRLEIETKYSRDEKPIRRLFAQVCFGDPNLFEPSAQRGCFHLSRLADPDFAMAVDAPAQVCLEAVHFEILSASELDKDKASFDIRGQNVLKTLEQYALRGAMDPATIRRVAFRFHFPGAHSERLVTILGADKIVFKHTAHQDAIYRYLRQWGVMA